MKETLFLKNAETFAESMIRCGVRLHIAYPITPASDAMKYSSSKLPEVGGRLLQMESEIAVANALAGYAVTGKLGATSTSGPGIDLMQEAFSYIAAGELPCIILDVMRVGPGDGDIIGAQCDYYQATRGGGHGDYRMLVFAPTGGQEIVDLMPKAVKLAYSYRTPVLFLMDGVTGLMSESATFDEPYDYSADFDTSSWACTGAKGRPRRIFATGVIDHEDSYLINERLNKKFELMKEKEQMWEQEQVDDAEVLVVAFGIHGRMCKDLVAEYRAKGKKVGFIRPITLWPFPDKAFVKLPASLKSILVVEMNLGQMIDDVRLAVNGRVPVHFLGKTGGDVPLRTLGEMSSAVDKLF